MTDRPIIFSAPMVKALLDGRKTMTRRLAWQGRDAAPVSHVRPSVWASVKPGDRLYVRENWKPHSTFAHMKPREIPKSNVFYQADDRYAPSNTRWVPCIHMPRWASRLTLTVTATKIERLQEISEEDARAEGCPFTWDGKSYDPPPPEVDSWQGYGRASFAFLWSKLHGADSWNANPEAVALSFSVEKINIDAKAAA